MKRQLSTTLLWLTLGVLLMAAAFAPFNFTQQQALAILSAQPSATPQLFLVRETRVKPEMAQEYRMFMQNETIPAYKKGGVKLRNTLTTTIFGEVLEYVSIEPVENLKQFDDQGPLRKALGEEGQRVWNTKWLRMIASSQAYMLQLRPELSILPKSNDAPKLGLLVTHKVALGRTAEFEAIARNDVLPIFGKTNLKALLMGKVVLGGDSNEYLSMIWFDSFDELQKWAAAAQLQGFGKIAPKEAGIVLHRETAVYRYLPELSIRPEPPKAVDKP